MAKRHAWTALVAALLLVDSVLADGWQFGQATHYTNFGSGGDDGSCGYDRLSNRFPTGRNICAWPDNTGHMCGKCIEIQCDERVVTTAKGVTFTYTANPGFCKKGAKVVVMVSDNCPADRNPDWCTGDKPHCDLSMEAFATLVDDPVRKGIMATKWREVPCPGPTYQKPAGCNRELPAWATCGDTNGPFADSCCAKYLKCQKMHSHYWQCRVDKEGNWAAGSSGSSSGSGNSVSISSGDNRRRRQPRQPRMNRRRRVTPRKPPTKPKPAPKRKSNSRDVKSNRRTRKPKPATPKGCKHMVGHWGQCGGTGGPWGNKKLGRDGKWKGYCCKKGSCKRTSKWFWQCK